MRKFIWAIFLVLILTSGAQAAWANELETSGWIPYWTVRAGTRDARNNLKHLTEINPFGYSVKENGKLNDLAKIKGRDWQRLFSAARKAGIRVIPSIMWSDGATIHQILSNPKTRATHVKNIVTMVKRGKYDGVDIDYEAKKAETNPYFSLFLTELKRELGDKLLSCTIESRTPPESLYTNIPATLQYANDLPTIGRVCDQVKVMTYDQRNADIKLNAANAASFYFPVSDVNWVRKVMTHMALTIPKDKLVLGIPTYGHEYSVEISSTGKKLYTRIGSINPEPARDKAKELMITPTRQVSGEIGYTYASNGALRYVTWSDAEAVRQKVSLAKESGWRGVAIFKIDGGEDRGIWDVLGDYR